MSKKSRKRNKKILGALAAGLGAMALMKGRGKGAVSTVGQPVGVDRMSTNTPPILGTDHIKKAVVADTTPADDSWLDVPKGPHGAGGKGDYWRKRKVPGYGTAVAPPSILNPYRTPRVHKRMVRSADGGRIGAKKGGSVKKAKFSGFAKRGFGRALKKGK